MIRKLIILQILVFSVIFCKSQISIDPYFELTKNTSTYLNPALSGIDGSGRIVSLYQNQYPELGSYQTYYLSYDQKVKELFGNVSVRAMYNRGQSGLVKSKSAYVAYTSDINLFNGKVLVFPSVELGVIQNSYKLDLLFPEINIFYGTVTSEPPEINNPATAFDINSGIVIAHHNLIFGTSLHHITQPEDVALYSTNSSTKFRLPIKYTVHASYTYEFNDKLRISPMVLYEGQDLVRLYATKISLSYNDLMSSVGLRFIKSWNRDGYYKGYNINLGYKFNKIVVGYSFVLYPSKLQNSTLSSHEFSVAFNFNRENKEDNKNRIEFINF
ncbi:MAG: PorP/SprF family type IX secretion system membrane protein [Bacteroidales bacterium]|jgi:type IX secretion system PorP/SprF family membrane protein|nr:PorP/SprF family type IX secretion system membrane protein [Bacteroidales bacterium]